MATGLLPYAPLAVMATASSSSSAERKPGPAGRRTPSSSSSSSSNNSWLAPIFGFSSEPDYIDSAAGGKVAYPRKADLKGGSSLSTSGRPRPDPIRFTEEKARLLRLMTSDDAASLHDTMNHSAIASRLASDFGNRVDL
ncbi:hypothetical protein BT93_L2895 [Corymbia citriodora subsp. variegata]|uniref:Uncharacterized protein n=1 Tax=Corymbia citriodora subsp. variegata TaxID=360336 RepID=A0A8T0CJT3_CORYI|nr:hypothetical protein BT93_L2895 [Corymbia citriodora subsp. variegata]